MQKTAVGGSKLRLSEHFWEYGIIFATGGIGYGALEILWRGYTHWSMLLTGGGCLCSIYAWNKAHPDAPLWQCCLVSGAVITGFEFVVGVLVNLMLKWNVWDYSRFKLNLFGQICLPYSLLWCVLGIPIRMLCRKLQSLIS